MNTLLFHKDIYIPDHAKRAVYLGPLSYSQHALNVSGDAADLERIELPVTFQGSGILIEAELCPVSGAVLKQVWRVPMGDSGWDLCFPLLPNGVVKTVWLNHATDTHKTLNRAKFVTGFQWRKLRGKLRQI